MKLSFVIPALNEEEGIAQVIKEIPVQELTRLGYETEILVVDNGSTDDTAHIATKNGARVITELIRGYGNAYKAGFRQATGDIIITGDADTTYPFSDSPTLLRTFQEKDLDFLTTDRLTTLNKKSMTYSHIFGNWLLSFATRILFSWPYIDSQSGMWIFKRSILRDLEVLSGGMPFSQELKLEAFYKGFKCDEVPIVYKPRIGQVKLNTIQDGIRNTLQLFKKRLTIKRGSQFHDNKK